MLLELPPPYGFHEAPVSIVITETNPGAGIHDLSDSAGRIPLPDHIAIFGPSSQIATCPYSCANAPLHRGTVRV